MRDLYGAPVTATDLRAGAALIIAGLMARGVTEIYEPGYIDRGYELFRKRVADGRKQPVEAIENIAQGHVWLGQDALKIKLVDQLGSLDEAVKKAAELAKLEDYYTSPYPGKPDLMESLMKTIDNAGGNYLDAQMRSTLGEFYEPFVLMKNMNKQSAIQARMPFFLNIR